MDVIGTWLVRSVHIAGAIVWVGSSALLAMVLLPRMARGETGAGLRGAVAATARVAAIASGVTFVFGLLLIEATRGYRSVFGTQWGTLLLIAIVAAIVMGGLGGAPLMRFARSEQPTAVDARRAATFAWAITGLGFIALLLMTGMLYSPR